MKHKFKHGLATMLVLSMLTTNVFALPIAKKISVGSYDVNEKIRVFLQIWET